MLKQVLSKMLKQVQHDKIKMLKRVPHDKIKMLKRVQHDKIKMLKQLTASLTHTSSQSSYLACSFCKVQHDSLFCHPEFISGMAIQDMSLRGANVVSDAAIHNSTKAGLLHFVRNDKIKMLKRVPHDALFCHPEFIVYCHPEFISGSKFSKMLKQVQHDTIKMLKRVQHDSLSSA